ncbi:MAG: c-type cytochrome [Lacipirellulaceae bacterium]
MNSSLLTTRTLSVALLCLCALGCSQSEPPEFRLNMVSMTSNELGPEYQQEIANVLSGLFGTPDKPFAHPATGLDQLKLDLSAGPAWSDERGYNHGLYRKHCVHCHGIDGDGYGPTAKILNPYPRDYRKGIFKFKSTFNAAKPTDADLERILRNGVPGTSMPSFELLPSSEVESLVEYVKYLAIKGQMETSLAAYVFDELGIDEVEDEDGNVTEQRIPFDPANDADQAEAVLDILAEVMEGWETAEENVIIPVEDQIPADDRSPEELAASIERGRELFYGTKANCIKCHGPTGLGDGQQTDYHVWNKEAKDYIQGTIDLAESLAKADPETDEEEADLDRDYEILAARQEVAETLLPPRNAIPRNLRKGIYRGGRRRIDVFHKIHAGIAGSPMPGLGGSSPGAEGTIPEADMWAIVDYVLNLPYEAPSQPQRALPVNEQPIAQ